MGIIFIGFGQGFYMAFGMDLVAYHTFNMSFMTMLEMMMGEFDMSELRAVNSTLGPLLFIWYIAVMFFIIVNMVVAIINEAYGTVKEEIGGVEDEFLNTIKSDMRKSVQGVAALGKRLSSVGRGSTARRDPDTPKDTPSSTPAGTPRSTVTPLQPASASGAVVMTNSPRSESPRGEMSEEMRTQMFGRKLRLVNDQLLELSNEVAKISKQVNTMVPN